MAQYVRDREKTEGLPDYIDATGIYCKDIFATLRRKILFMDLNNIFPDPKPVDYLNLKWWLSMMEEKAIAVS